MNKAGIVVKKNNWPGIKIFLIVAGCIFSYSVSAQDTTNSKAANAALTVDTSAANKFPKQVLVQLRTEQNRIKALTKAGNTKALEEVQKDAEGERQAMINDFEKNYHYCPVYYFIDTNFEKIKKQDFDGILLNADGTKANVKIPKGNNDYVIAYYGYLSERYYHKISSEDSMRNEYDAEVPEGRGLLLANKNYQVITYFYKLDYQNALYRFFHKRDKTLYQSKHFDIEYFPFADVFNKKIGGKEWRMAFLQKVVKLIIGDSPKGSNGQQAR